MNIVDKAAPATATPVNPTFESDQPTQPLTGKVVPADKAAEPKLSAVAKAKAELLAGANKTPAPATSASDAPKGNDGASATAPAAPETKPGELTDEMIAKAETKSKELAAIKDAVVEKKPAEEDFVTRAKKAEELFKTDPLKAMELLGMPLDKAVKQAMGSKTDEPTEEDKLRAENKRLADEIEDGKKAAQQAEAQRQQAAAYNATVTAIIADKELPNITSAEHVTAALADARDKYKVLTTELGRDLNETEKDRLVRYFLKRHNDRPSESATSTRPQEGKAQAVESTLRSGSVQPAQPKQKTRAQAKAELLAGRN